MTSIFPSGNALKATNITNKSSAEASELIEKLSSGKRINSGADDAGDLFKLNNIKAKVLNTKSAIRNVTDLMSMAQLADQSYTNINNILMRTNDLSLQSTNQIYKDADRQALNNEVQNLISEVDNIAHGVAFNGKSLINSSEHVEASIGIQKSGGIALNIGNINTSNIGLYSQSTRTFSNDLNIETFDGTNKASFTYENISSNSDRRIDIGKSQIPNDGEAFFSGSYIDLSLDNSEFNNEATKLSKLATASHALDSVSVVGSNIYVGNGTTAEHIATIDSTLDGTDGKKLRLNIVEPAFTNGNFEAANDLEGWTLKTERINLDGVALIDNKVTPIDTTYHINNSNLGLNDSDPLANEGTMSGGITNSQVNSGTNAVRLTSANLTSSTGYATVRGPYLYSNSYVTLGTSSSVSFAWRAQGGGDAYDVHAYLVDIDNPANKITLLDEHTNDTTGSSPWATKTVNINKEGTYQFVFVAGSYDASGGKALGAQLYVDDISVTNAARKLSGNVIESIGSLLYGEVDAAANTGLSIGSSVETSAKTISSGQQVDLLGTLGRENIEINQGEIAEEISKKINAIADKTGVEATSSTQAMISFENTAGTNLSDRVSFNLYGVDGVMKKISSVIDFGSGNQDMDLAPLKTEINKFSSSTDITAYLSEDKQAITLKSRQGFDILIEDFNLENDNNSVSLYINEMKDSGQVSPTSIKLSQSSAGADATDSARIFGEVILKSHKHFSMSSSEIGSVLAIKEKNLEFASLSSIAVRSFETAKKSIDIIKYSMKSIAMEQSKVGGLANQLQQTLGNLSKTSGIDKMTIGRLEDIDVAKTVVSLQKSNYIQDVASAMVNRVKSTMEAVLQILNR